MTHQECDRNPFKSTPEPLNFSRRKIIAALSCAAVSVQAQPTGLLYDPEPPPDSGYVRVMSLANASQVSVFINGRPRVTALARHQASEYMVVPAGRHQIDLVTAGKLMASVGLDVVRASATTVVFGSAAAAPHLFNDKTSTNKLKSMLSVYHLAGRNDTLDVLTVDGSTRVLSGLAYGTLGAIQVNPIAVDVMAVKSGTQTSLARASLNMSQGEAYSVFLLSDLNHKTVAVVAHNKIERYTGR